MSRLDSLVDNKIAQNIVVWVFIFLIALVSIQSENVVLSAILGVLFLAVPVYIHNLKILPLFFSSQKWLATLLFALNLAVFTILGLFFLSDSFDRFEWRMVYNMIGILVLTLFVSSALKIAGDSFTRRQQSKEAELQLLKAQLNPHFLFNTLNNLYGLSVAKSDKLPNLMLKLSDLLRYSLYDTKETFVPLEKELSYLENYMSLERIRLEDQTSIEFHKKGDFSRMEIAPMLLIVFVENAFKHLASFQDQKSRVAVAIEKTEDGVHFSCINTMNPNAKHPNLETGKSGIGLQNAKKRLSILYPEQHQLRIETVGNEYQVSLKINKK